MSEETRDKTRFEHEASILIEDYPKGSYFHGKMFNYSQGGMYFESNIPFKPGSIIIFGIENSPYNHCPGVYKAKIKWCKKLPEKASLYYYGVGVKFYKPNLPSERKASQSGSDKKISADTHLTHRKYLRQTEQPDSDTKENKKPLGQGAEELHRINSQNLRKHTRKPYVKPIHYSGRNQFYEGLVKDISRGGLFIKSQDKFPAGQELRLVIPIPTKNKSLKLVGKVVRINQEGFAVKFKSKLRS
jgi:Tfp pilus assembly protein PilZ